MTNNARRKQVCLFGLSADPPTGNGGHVGIARTLSVDKVFDEVRILPVYRHQFNVRTDNFKIMLLGELFSMMVFLLSHQCLSCWWDTSSSRCLLLYIQKTMHSTTIRSLG
jgi:hypothetical protein